MNKKKTLLAVMIATILLLSACGTKTTSDSYGSNSTAPPTSNSEDNTATTDSATFAPAEETTRPKASADLSSEWSSYQFELEGKLYTLPFRYSELEANGWSTLDTKELDETLEAGKYTVTSTTIVNNNKENCEISIQFSNLDDNDMPLKDCYVSGISLFDSSWSKNTVLYFPGGLTIGSTKEEVNALYGESGDVNETSATIVWKYQTENYTDVIFNFIKETGKIESMKMYNPYLP